MGREIKFRAWDAVNEEMVYNVHLNDGKPVKPGYQWFNPQNTVHDSEPMQYTGLRDKNGTEIYEGDICRYEDRLYEIRWVDRCAKCGAKVIKSQHVLIRGCIFPLQDYVEEEKLQCILEVIGNIYENLELLNANTVSE